VAGSANPAAAQYAAACSASFISILGESKSTDPAYLRERRGERRHESRERREERGERREEIGERK